VEGICCRKARMRMLSFSVTSPPRLVDSDRSHFVDACNDTTTVSVPRGSLSLIVFRIVTYGIVPVQLIPHNSNF
jgi:hypothetical protein